ncbi:sulfurtransferase [Corynebacterium sp. SCR221107]|uniref:sulfurtransferase n=1 Tax=Corynebacterium sp. SCR221107 TaxID=3017361 RepID=UPI0022EC65C2|nr:sulfurtransferase [Corynebacterium sp. SCR221107]WBT09766.1 sulfurtransferase [Corynebacterium sp. SCR221107]
MTTPSTTFSKPIISAVQLHEILDNPRLVILDASMAKAAEATEFLPGARYFDIDGDFSDHSNRFPHGLQSPEEFQAQARKLGLNDDSIIVVYESKGVFASPRAWWLLRSMGHAETYVLDGGMRAWKAAGFETVDHREQPTAEGNFVAHFNPRWFILPIAEVKRLLDTKEKPVLDARSAGRFAGTEPEPRKGVRSGHMPGAKNLPFTEVLNEHGLYKSKEELQEIFEGLAGKSKSIVTSCGSGVTAAIIGLGAHLAGIEEVAIFDGSWTEWEGTDGYDVETS